MGSWFISDLHLDPARPALTDILLRALAGPMRAADHLYILGDLFEAWVGDDGADALAATVADGLQTLSSGGVPISFICGNRDFLLGADFARRCGMRRLPDPCVVELYGRPTLLSHGDALCSGDSAYQAFRRQVRDPDWQAGFLGQPLAARQAYAVEARRASAEHQRGMQAAIADVDPESVTELLIRFGVDRLIHGHTHRPAEHGFALDGRQFERLVLSDWRSQGEALLVDQQGYRRVPLD